MIFFGKPLHTFPDHALDRQRGGALDRAQGQRRLHAGDAGQLGQDAGVDALEIRSVAVDDPQHVVGGPRDQVALDDFRAAVSNLSSVVRP
jgi:hypothetical protein